MSGQLSDGLYNGVSTKVDIPMTDSGFKQNTGKRVANWLNGFKST